CHQHTVLNSHHHSHLYETCMILRRKISDNVHRILYVYIALRLGKSKAVQQPHLYYFTIFRSHMHQFHFRVS
ncbi:hypothetical protein BDZ91DRAFT_733150, partial [Kalaharituber pfeilii]